MCWDSEVLTEECTRACVAMELASALDVTRIDVDVLRGEVTVIAALRVALRLDEGQDGRRHS